MNYQAIFRFSLLALSVTLTLARDVWFGAGMFHSVDVAKSRHPRDTSYHHIPCVFMSQLTDIKDRFIRWLDHNDDGHATFEEVKAFLKKLRHDVTDDTIDAFIRRRDANGNGSIELIPEYLKEFVEGDYGPEAASEWFHLQDVNGDGLVSKEEIVHLGKTVGLSPEMAEVTAVSYYLPMDQDGDGNLNFREFSALYQPPPGANV